ncbi:DUF1684 domain-containing protein [Microbacterium sp. 77mftsu3.1]|uniref:DUF1684 domain-containing protein n=1 Tax=Microbacterium sp. 77mftsu3.1 TaxID=1761802 RepID=UPI00037D832A|nr:DUF1684 domain-containing protein [Microbacterium sp. 77mftsu3.1]SDG43252.1 hypothetical protein SAMN04488590_0985 [Microbacterium sp. 77mftsu3.1]
MIPSAARTALDVVDWRRRVFALYADVRAAPHPEAGHELWQHGRNELLAHHPATPILPEHRADFDSVPVAPYDPAWRFELPLLPTEPGGFEFATGTDGVVPFERVAIVDLPDVGTLDVWRLTTYGGGLFIPVRDALAGKPDGTYGGGRYLIDTIKGADLGTDAEAGTIVLDLNFAYNPSCAYDPAWACPLAQPGNVLAVEVPVGERYAGV